MNNIIFALIAGIIIYILVTKYGDYSESVKTFLSNEKKQEDQLENEDNFEEEEEEEQEEINTEDADSFFNISDTENFEDNIDKTDKKLVYLDLSINGNRGRIILELFTNIVPKTCNNFIQLCDQKAYQNTKFHRVIKDFMIQGGDFTKGDGTGGRSIYGNTFEDENFKLKNKKGSIAMANSGPNANGSQFFINVIDTPWLDNKHVVFGNVVKGIDLVEWISKQPTNDNDVPETDVIVEDCGTL
mgnify:CR=1 FL=1